MTDNEAKREKTFEEELPYVEERIKEVFNNYHNPNGCEDRLEICVLRDCKRTIRKAKEEIDRQKAEIEKLKGSVIINNIMEIQKIKREAKFEAIKEFAERLKEKSFKTIRNYGLTKDVVEVCDIDNIVKEMVGAKNDR